MSSLLTSGQPARRLLLSTAAGRVRPSQHAIPSISSPSTSIIPTPPSSHQPVRRRQYATKISPVRPPPPAPPPPPISSTSPASKLSARGGPEEEAPRWIFSPADVPLLPEWAHGLETLGNTTLTPMQCMQAAQRYVSVATQHESHWRPRLEKGTSRPSHTPHPYSPKRNPS